MTVLGQQAQSLVLLNPSLIPNEGRISAELCQCTVVIVDFLLHLLLLLLLLVFSYLFFFSVGGGGYYPWLDLSCAPHL